MAQPPVTPDRPAAALSRDDGEPALRVQDLHVGLVEAGASTPLVTGVDLELGRREVLGLVGESGSGKSLTCLAIARLLDEPTLQVLAGSAALFGTDLLALPESRMRDVRGGDIGVVFQDPMTSLDPAFTAGYQLTAVLRRHTGVGKAAARRRAVELLGLVGIGDPERRFGLYPHEMSGGMRQRVMIAMAISCEPRLLIADEPTTALDATTQAQILELIKRLAGELEMSTVITTHDLGVVAEVCDTVAVMYAGQVVEQATTEQLFHRPRHPYTERLLRSLPRIGVQDDATGIPGTPPAAGRFPPGCRFAPRCEHVRETCTRAPVPLEPVEGDRGARCVRVDELELQGVRG